jgi:amino acid transporter
MSILRMGGAQARVEPPTGRRREQGLRLLTLSGFATGGVIGSGWLLGIGVAAQQAGVLSLLSWGIAGVTFLLLAVSMGWLASTQGRPVPLTSWPERSSGRVVTVFTGCCIWIVYAASPAIEAVASVQYLGHFWPVLWNGNGKHPQLTVAGQLASAALMAVFVAINALGVRWLVRAAVPLSYVKLSVAVITALALLCSSSWHWSNVTAHHSQHGLTSALQAMGGAGIVFAFTGFQGPHDLVRHARDPRRDTSRATLIVLVTCLVVYLALEIGFLGTVSSTASVNSYTSNQQFLDLTKHLGMTWLFYIIAVDAVLSPSGTALVFIAFLDDELREYAANRYQARAQSRWILGSFRWRLPGNRHFELGHAMTLNYIVGVLLLAFLRNWDDIVSRTTLLVTIAYLTAPVAYIALLRQGVIERKRPGWLVWSVALGGFVLGTLVLYWTGWTYLGPALGVALLLGVLSTFRMWSTRWGWRQWQHGLWLVCYFVVLLLLSCFGSEGSPRTRFIPQPWDSIIVGLFAVGAFLWAVYSARDGAAVSQPQDWDEGSTGALTD